MNQVEIAEAQLAVNAFLANHPGLQANPRAEQAFGEFVREKGVPLTQPHLESAFLAFVHQVGLWQQRELDKLPTPRMKQVLESLEPPQPPNMFDHLEPSNAGVRESYIPAPRILTGEQIQDKLSHELGLPFMDELFRRRPDLEFIARRAPERFQRYLDECTTVVHEMGWPQTLEYFHRASQFVESCELSDAILAERNGTPIQTSPAFKAMSAAAEAEFFQHGKTEAVGDYLKQKYPNGG